MRTLFRWAFRFLILLIVLLVAGVLLLDPVARALAEYRLSRQTGLEVKIGKVDIGLLSPRVTVENLVIYNSPEFGGSPLLDLPELHVEYDLGAFLSHQLHYRLIRLNFASGNVVEDKAGRLNLEVLAKQLEKVAGASRSNGNRSPDYKFLGVDALNLTLGRVDFLSLKNPAHSETLKLGVRNQVMTNVKTAESLQGLYLWVLLKNGINIVSRDTNNPNDPWQYWRARLEAMGTRQQPAK